MITPTGSEVIAIKADARRRFGSDRALSCPMTSPIDACVVVAPFGLKAYSDHVDMRGGNVLTAQSGAVTERVLWCSPTLPITGPLPGDTVDTLAPTKDDPEPVRRVALQRLELLRGTWPAVDGNVELELRRAAGWVKDLVSARPLTAGNPPSGLSAGEALALLADAPGAGAGSLWSVSHPSGLALVLKAPRPNAWLAARAAFGEAHAKHVGIIESTLVLVRQLVVWSPAPIDDYLEEHPGFAEALWNPLLDMGGSSAQTSSAFL